jgi:hypothetical protein
MVTKQFCTNAKCAKITITPEGSKPVIVISKCPRVIVDEYYTAEEIYAHDMTAPIEKTFSFLIEGVDYVEGSWFCNVFDSAAGDRRLSCPMPGTYPYLDEAGATEFIRGKTTSDLYWVENKLHCYFEPIARNLWESYYPNNSGVCTYRVYGAKGYKFLDRQGLIYQTKPKEIITYEIECDACCKDTEILCDHHKYPGYKCYPIPPINSQLANNRYDISRLFE